MLLLEEIGVEAAMIIATVTAAAVFVLGGRDDAGPLVPLREGRARGRPASRRRSAPINSARLIGRSL